MKGSLTWAFLFLYAYFTHPLMELNNYFQKEEEMEKALDLFFEGFVVFMIGAGLMLADFAMNFTGLMPISEIYIILEVVCMLAGLIGVLVGYAVYRTMFEQQI